MTSELAEQEAGLVVRFVTAARAIAQPVGPSSYLNIDRQHRRVEIGGTLRQTSSTPILTGLGLPSRAVSPVHMCRMIAVSPTTWMVWALR